MEDDFRFGLFLLSVQQLIVCQVAFGLKKQRN